MRSNLASLLCYALVAALSSSCRTYLRTYATPRLDRLDGVDLEQLDRNQCEILLGSPQGVGVQTDDDGTNELSYYFGLKGWLNPFGDGQLDSGKGYISFDADGMVADLLIVQSRFDGPRIRTRDTIRVSEAAAVIQMDQSTTEDLVEALGEPEYQGRRYNRSSKVDHRLLFYDGSRTGSRDTIGIQWLFVGYSEHDQVLRDVLWVSSNSDDFEELQELQSARLRATTKPDFDYPFSVNRVESMSTSLRIDPAQIEAVLRTDPGQLKDFVDVIGPPLARGAKSFAEGEPLQISLWISEEAEVLGNEYGPPMEEPTPRNSPGLRTPPPQKSYVVMRPKHTLLLLAHSEEGDIHEVVWIKPILPAG